MCFGAGARLVVLLCACLAAGTLTACGDGTADEVTLGGEVDSSRSAKNRQKIRELERRLAQQERRERRAANQATSDVKSGGAGVLSETLASTLGGEIGVAVGAVGADAAQQLGPLQSGSAWSTIKLPIAARTIEDAGGPEALSANSRDLIRRAITASDNAAAASLWEQLGSQHGGPSGAATAVGELLAAAGDTETTVSTVGRDGFSPYGQTEWSLRSQERFMSGLAAGCVTPAASGELQTLMGQVVSDQRWGLGSTGVTSYFKGGWGPGSDGRYLVRQVGVASQDGGSIAVALAAIPSDGQFATGTAAVSQLAQWVVDNTVWSKAVPQAC
jgi:hypothetical protein